jgi:hypothetical protein
MRSFYSTEKFFQKMKKKKEVQEVLDNLDHYTIDQLSCLTGTHFPLWIREELIKLKNRNGKTADSEAERIAALMISASKKNI